MKNKLINIISGQFPVFVISLIIFIVLSILGWENLHHGFNFVDEGFYMTEAWRLTVGDHVFQDKVRGAIDMSPIMNSLLFRINPDITLLGVRKIQYILTICALFLFGITLYKVTKLYWYQPFIFSIFAFTGLSPAGGYPILNHYSYPHLFITLHLAFLLLGLSQQSIVLRRSFFIFSGFLLWLISFNLLQLSIIVFSPIIQFYFLRKWKTNYVSFDFKDLCFVLAPILFCWLVFIGIFNKAYLHDILVSVQINMSSHGHSTQSLIQSIINWEVIKHIILTSVFLVIFLYILLRFRHMVSIICISVCSILMYFIIDTNLWGAVIPYFNLNFLSQASWFSSLLVSMFLFFISYFFWKMLSYNRLNKTDIISILLLTPCILLSISLSAFCTAGYLSVLYTSIPVIGAMSTLILFDKRIKTKSHLMKLLILFIFLIPFYYSAAWSGWHFPFFDMASEYTNVEIEHGFGKGIRTNVLYKNLYDWISESADKYTSNGDFIISYTVSPMVHMIAKRRPALDNSWIDTNDFTPAYYKKAISFMIENGRQPHIAFIFEDRPILWPNPFKDNMYSMIPEISFPANDAISKYVVEYMYQVSDFRLNNEIIARCFVKK